MSHTNSTRSPAPSGTPSAAASTTDASGTSWLEVAQSRRDRRLRKGTAIRLTCYFGLTVLLGVGVTAWLLVQRSGVSTNQAIAAMARRTGTSLADAAALPIRSRNVTALQRLGDRALAFTTADDLARIERIEFIDRTGTAVASAALPDADGVADANSTHTLSVDVPILAGDGSTIGQVRLTVDTEQLDRSRYPMYQAFAALCLGVLAAAGLVVWVFSRGAMRPLKDLTTAIRKVVDGDREVAISVRGGNATVFQLGEAAQELASFARRQRELIDQEHRAAATSIRELQAKIMSNSAQLEAANGRLQSEIAEKEDFLRAVSHDLNAPLRNIGGMVAMLLTKDRATLAPEVVNRLERIKKNVDVETDLINELLELSRIKTRRQTLEVVDTESIVWDLRGLFENDLKTRGIELVLETSLPSLYAERARVRQVFLNLIDNAIKYMGDDKPTRQIRIGCRVRVTEAEFYVADTGLGIHPEDLDKVFGVFRRGRGEIATKVPGKGVGLASVKSIIETYAGRIWVTSELGVGTTFHFAINGKYVPSVSAQLPSEMCPTAAESARVPTLAGAPPNTAAAA